MSRLRPFVVLLALVLAPLAARAQGAAGPLLGRWQVEYERGRRIMGDVPEIILGKATLEVTAQGDSLLMVLTPEPAPSGATPQAQRLSGAPGAQGAVFVQKLSRTLNVNGESQVRTITETWTLRAVGDVLEGSLLRAVEGAPFEPTPTPVKGTRVAR